MTINGNVISWLLEDDNPAVRYRTQTEILGKTGDKAPILPWLNRSMPKDWPERQQGIFKHYLTALSECGLAHEDVPWDKGRIIQYGSVTHFGHSCADYLHLRALVRLGLAHEPTVAEIIRKLPERQLPDGGFLCLHRLDKLKYIPKSCVKANMAALMLCAECKKKDVTINITNNLLNYFWNHNLFYRTDDPSALILNAREGWRSIDTFHPFEPMRVGLHNILESFCALGYGNDLRLDEAWYMLESRRNAEDKYILDGTLTKSYLPKERAGKPGKWVTFYALLARKERDSHA